MTVDEIRPYRLEYLRRGTASHDVVFAEDDLPGTCHLAVRGDDGRLLAISSWNPAESPDRPGQPGLQLRGMAVAPDHRRRGFGEALIAAGLELAARQGVTVVWANARDTALPFYTALGFEVVGEGFVTADTRLPHHRIVRQVGAVSAAR